MSYLHQFMLYLRLLHFLLLYHLPSHLLFINSSLLMHQSLYMSTLSLLSHLSLYNLYSNFTNYNLVLSYPIYMFRLVIMYFMLYHMHIDASILFTLYYLSLWLHYYMLFHLPNIVQMLYLCLSSNNILLHLIMIIHHLLI